MVVTSMGTTSAWPGRADRAGALAHAAALALCLLLALLSAGNAFAQTSQPRTISFPSADGRTTLVGYLFAPAGRPKIAPAVVLMHGRSGVYSSLAKGNYSAITMEKRIRNWADLWAAQGYWVLVVDSFEPRGYPAGFAAGTDATRPQAVNEVTVRPLDAIGALRYLRASPRVRGDRIALQGWSNGASATLAGVSTDMLALSEADAGHGFRVALALYPGCGLQEHFKAGYVPYVPVRIFIGSRDEEVSVSACEKLATATKAAGGDIGLTIFEGATHDFDDPGRLRQSVPANQAATAETRKQAIALFAAALGH